MAEYMLRGRAIHAANRLYAHGNKSAPVSHHMNTYPRWALNCISGEFVPAMFLHPLDCTLRCARSPLPSRPTPSTAFPSRPTLLFAPPLARDVQVAMLNWAASPRDQGEGMSNFHCKQSLNSLICPAVFNHHTAWQGWNATADGRGNATRRRFTLTSESFLQWSLFRKNITVVYGNACGSACGRERMRQRMRQRMQQRMQRVAASRLCLPALPLRFTVLRDDH